MAHVLGDMLNIISGGGGFECLAEGLLPTGLGPGFVPLPDFIGIDTRCKDIEPVMHSDSVPRKFKYTISRS